MTSRAANPLRGIAEPLQQPVFRRIWLSSLFSNLGQQVQAVAAAWMMVQLAPDPGNVSLVQTASMAPIMLIALPAGAIADMYDRRKAAIVAILIALLGAALLAILSYSGHVTPTSLLVCCFIVGVGIALFSPAWQASVREQVPQHTIPSAVALYAMSSNIARSLGPGVGGALVAIAGVNPAFLVNMLLYLPILAALFLWRREHVPQRLPPEGMYRAIQSGLRYVAHSSPIRRVLLRTVSTAIGVGAIYSLLPLVAHSRLGGGAGIFGILLCAFGVGAVLSAFAVASVRTVFGVERSVSLAAAMLGLAILVIALSKWVVLTAFACLVAGGMWMVSTSMFNVAVQLSASRWVAGRALATFQAAAAGGLALGSLLWGHVASETSVVAALAIAGGLMMASPLLARLSPMPTEDDMKTETLEPRSTLDVQLDLTGRSGPIVVEIEYRVDLENARRFYYLMQEVRKGRERNGAFGVSLARDIAAPELWVERFHYPTWHDYLRGRTRMTLAEDALHQQVRDLDVGADPSLRTRRLLERPYGSVRWQERTPDYLAAEDASLVPTNGDSV